VTIREAMVDSDSRSGPRRESAAVADVLVIGAGPYGLSAAAATRALGLRTEIVGKPMAFWREHMPAGMFLRSGPDWHLDPAHEFTLERYLEERDIRPDPLPLGLFLDYADWFATEAGLDVKDEHVVELREDEGFAATMESGAVIRARNVIAAPGIAHFTHTPEWAQEGVHTCDLTDFTGYEGARVLIVGGRQSAYEWAALLGEHGAERIDVVHRHDTPRFEEVSWRFVDPLVEQTLSERGWWRNLPSSERDAVGRRFWEVGRLTLEHWLKPRLDRAPLHIHANAHVVSKTRLSDGTRIAPDRIVFATGYKADLARVPYLAPLLDRIEQRNGFPALDPAMQSTIEGLYFPGFTATQDFGPFFGFVKGAPAAAQLIAREIS
jgi:cation diffusion facilitator CzcD-associated flavoprotein CzcO